MNRYIRYIVGWFTVVLATVSTVVAQPSYPIYVSVQVVPPAGIYLTDYYSGTRDRLVVTLINRDNEQPMANVRLRVVIRNGSVFELRSREELHYPMLTLESGVPLRLTSMDLAPYLAPDRVTINGYLENGRLPNGMTEFRVQALDYTTGRMLSDVAVGRVWLESKQPPLLSQPTQGDLLPLRNPQHIRFQWMPRHQGLAQTMYELVVKELPDGGAPPQTAFLYGPEIYRTQTQRTTFDYGTMEPPLEPGKRYGWQVRAQAMDGVDEIGVFDNQGYSEISWFEVSDNCPEVTQVKAKAGFRRIDLSWYHHPDQNAFVVQWRPKTQSAGYEWQGETVFENSYTIERLQEGWTYEYRVGALCIRNEPVFSSSGEVTLPEQNEERLKNCGKTPIVDLANQEPNENLEVGDMVRIGGDFPMRVDEVTPLGNGWYSGKGGLILPWIFEIGVNVEFARLRVNTDNVQIDGEVETSYDQGEALIGNTNQLDNGGSKLEQGGIELPNIEVDFTVPDMPQCEYNVETGELVITDEDGANPQTITVPKNEGKSSFPMEVVDADGNRYQVDLPADTDLSAADSTATSGAKEPLRPTITKVEDAAGTINTKELSKEAKFNIRFTRGDGVYAFDEGREDWLQDSKLLRDEFYKPFGDNYVAPWKLVPVGETDEVTATLAAGEGFDQSKLDRSKIKFVTADGKGVAAKDDGTKWVLTVPATGAGQTIDIFAVYEKNKNRPLTVGKLRVVSYAVQHHTVTLVPVGVEAPDAGELQRKLNGIYAPYGVEFTVKVDGVIKDLEGWKGRTFKLEGNGFFTRENADMAEIRKAYQAVQSTPKGSYYVFVLGRADASSEDGATQANGAQGDMPRGQQFGYVFGDGVQDWSWLLAHELGHGVFTLQHLEDGNYGTKGTLGSIANLMNYTRSTELQAFQWNIMSNPAILTALDSDDASKAPQTTTHEQDIKRFFNLFSCALKSKDPFDFPYLYGKNYNAKIKVGEESITIELSLKEGNLVDYIPLNTDYKITDRSIIGVSKFWMEFDKFYIYTDKKHYQLIVNYLKNGNLTVGSDVLSAWSNKDEDALYHFNKCEYSTVSIDVRLDILKHFSDKRYHIAKHNHTVVTLLSSIVDNIENSRVLYSWFETHPKETLSLYDGLDDENTRNRFLEFVSTSFANYYQQYKLDVNPIRDYVFDAADVTPEVYLEIGTKGSNLTISQRSANESSYSLQHSDVNPVEAIRVLYKNSSKKQIGCYAYVPAILLRSNLEDYNTANRAEFVNGVIQVASVYSGVGLLARGGSVALKIVGAIELTNIVTTAIVLSDAVQNQLKQTDYGRKFLELWPKISATTDIATIFTFYAVTKLSLNKISNHASISEIATINNTLQPYENIIFDISEHGLSVKNMRVGTGKDFVIIGTQMEKRVKPLAEKLLNKGYNVEILDEAYFIIKNRTFNIDGRQWTIKEAVDDMINIETHKSWRDVNGRIKPEHITQVPFYRINEIWITEIRNNRKITVVDIGNPTGINSQFYDGLELKIMNWK